MIFLREKRTFVYDVLFIFGKSLKIENNTEIYHTQNWCRILNVTPFNWQFGYI